MCKVFMRRGKDDLRNIAQAFYKFSPTQLWHFNIKKDHINRVHLQKDSSIDCVSKLTNQFEAWNFFYITPYHVPCHRFVINYNTFYLYEVSIRHKRYLF